MLKNNGFTLMEVLVAVAVVGILASLSVSTLMEHVPDMRLKSAAVQLYGDLRIAKSTAVMSREPVLVTFDTDGGYHMTRCGTDMDCGTDGDNTLIKTVTFADFGSGVQFGHGSATAPKGESFGDDHITYGGNNTVFGINGMVNKLGYVYLTNGNNQLCYAIGNPTMAGVVKMERTRGGDWTRE